MSLKQGRQFLAIPGPSNIPDEVLGAMHRPAVDIYTSSLQGMTESCLKDLKTIFGTTGHSFIYAANGHGAWEAALSNTMSRGERVLILESGRFALGWGDLAREIGIEVELLPGDERRAVDPAAVTARLLQDLADENQAPFKAVLVVQIDTASGVVNDIAAIRKAIDAAGHAALFFVDAIASLACMPFDMDAWGVDVAVGGAQKGLMTPPGLSFNAVNAKAMAAHQQAGLTTRYWSWTARLGVEHYQKYCGTPPEHLVFGLRRAFDMLFDEGFKSIFNRHALLAEATRRAVTVWSQDGTMELNIIKAEERASSVTTILMDGAHAGPLLAYCADVCNVVLGIGIGNFSGRAIRIAHMGYINAPMLLGTLAVVETGLQAVGVPHQKGGVQAAVDYLASETQISSATSSATTSAEPSEASADNKELSGSCCS